MPFVTKHRREIIDKKGLMALDKIEPGDRCYYYYRDMVKRWKANPRWTTAHEIYMGMQSYFRNVYHVGDNDRAAYELAWQIFFIWYVVPYEREAETKNGTI